MRIHPPSQDTIYSLPFVWMTWGMQNGQVPTSKGQFQLLVLSKEECAGAGTYGPLRTDYELHLSAPHLWHHFGSWKSAFGSRYSTKSSKCYKSGPDINYGFMTYRHKCCSSYACFPKHSVCVCVCVSTSYSLLLLLLLLSHFSCVRLCATP